MFDRFETFDTRVNGVNIHFVKGGEGPPLLLLHGYPQTHVMWHKIAEDLAEHFIVVASDLRGYGDSEKPPSRDDHYPYSKRMMAKDQVELMAYLGYHDFYVVGHDRGGRVGHRLALDYPDKVKKLVVMDIAPTYAMYHSTDKEFATAYYHWFFLIQPYDLPERMIGQDPVYYLEKKLGQWGRDPGAFPEKAWKEYIRCFTPATIHASCEDYRASATVDLAHDQIDLDQGTKITCPLLVMWGEKGFVGGKYDMVGEWSRWAGEVKSIGLPCGHYLPEEDPLGTFKALIEFL